MTGINIFDLIFAIGIFIFICRFLYKEIKHYKKTIKRLNEKNSFDTGRTPLEMLEKNYFLKIDTLKTNMLEIIQRYDNEKLILEYLTNSFLPILMTEKGIDTLMLRVSRQLMAESKVQDKPEIIENYKKAACLSKRLAHILYRNYKKIDENYTSPDFLQTI